MLRSNAVTSVGGPFPGSPAAAFSYESPGHGPGGRDYRCPDDEEVAR